MYQNLEHEEKTIGPLHESRRILKGSQITDTRPYMVYLRPAKKQQDPQWLCGGVIIDARYILTSAACIEDVTHFFIVSGTHRWTPPSVTNECIKNGAIKAVWKCVPKTYRFDGATFNNIQWMANDIAVVMVAEAFNFEKRVKGCDFIPQPIKYNNESAEHEAPDTKAVVAGWGSTEEYRDAADFDEIATFPVIVTNPTVPITEPPETIPPPPDAPPESQPPEDKPPGRSGENSPQLMEADVEILEKGSCKSLWHERYHEIIDEFMVCGKNLDFDELHQECEENQMECRELAFSEEAGGSLRRHHSKNFDKTLLQSLKKAKSLRKAKRKSLRREGKDIGGFCENDHGGPLIAGRGKGSIVIGIMSAYRTLNHSRRCVGPFLYTSVYNNRHLINCAINKQIGTQCRAVLRTSSTVLDQENIVWDVKKGPPTKKRSKHHNKIKSRKSNRTKSEKEARFAAVKLVSNDVKATPVKDYSNEKLLSAYRNKHRNGRHRSRNLRSDLLNGSV